MTEDLFVEISIAHQFGALPGERIAQDKNAQDLALSVGSGGLLWWAHEIAGPYPYNGWYLDGTKRHQNHEDLLNTSRSVNIKKATVALAEIHAAGADFDVFIDMQDRRIRSLVTETGAVQPVFSFNRIEGAVGRILWPLPEYQSIDSPEFLGNLDPTRIPWSQKRDQVAWRGSAGGRANPKGDVRHERTRLMPLLKKVKRGEVSVDKARMLLKQFPRHRFIDKYINDPRFDIGFVEGNRFTLRNEPLLAPLEKSRVPREDFQEFKYLAVLRGLDIGSSFFWTMNSGSLGLVMETPFESFASCHFKPWKHYVPFREDLSDFEDRLSWCQNNQNACQDMVHSAGELCKLLARTDLRHAIARGVVDEYRAKL